MVGLELTRECQTEFEDAILQMAQELIPIAQLVSDFPEWSKALAKGFFDLSILSQKGGEKKIYFSARAFSQILNQLQKSPEEDIPFILSKGIEFLNSIIIENKINSMRSL